MKRKSSEYPGKKRENWHHLLDSTIWNEFEFRNDDVFIVSYSKSGSTWVQQIVAQLIWKGAEGIVLSEVSPWIDCRFPTKEERLEIAHKQTHRRFLKSHLPVDSLVISPEAKYIYVGRDGRDVLWSLYNHHCIMKKDVVESIDSVPERTGPPLGEPPSSAIEYFRNWISKDGYPWWPYWAHVRSWWEIRDLPNVMLLHFSNLKRDMPAEIRHVAAFLEIAIDEAKWNVILEHCSFAYMKSHADQSVPFGGDIFKGGGKRFMHKGVNGRWRDMLSAADIAAYEQTAREKLGLECARWLATGEMQDATGTRP